MDFTRDDLAEYLRHMRNAIGASRQQFAEMLDINPEQLRRYEIGKYLPRNPEYFCQKVRRVVAEELKKRRRLSA